MTPFAYLAARWRHFRRDRPALLIAAHQHEERLRDHLRAEAERYAPDRRLDLYGKPWGGPWPADLCAYPPCDPEDAWICVHHKPAANGRHRIATVTDLNDRRPAQ